MSLSIYPLDLQDIYFVTRLKRGATFRVIERREPPPLSGVTSDQTIRIVGSKADSIPIDLRRIGYVDPATGHRYYFLTNLFHLSAKTIAEIYRSRWQVELFSNGSSSICESRPSSAPVPTRS